MHVDLIVQFRDIYEGDNWVDNSFRSAVAAITPALAFKQPPGGRNSIAAIVKHMMVWKNFAVQRLRNNTDFEVDQDDSFDVSDYARTPEEGWTQLLKEQDAVQRELLALLRGMTPTWLQQNVPGRSYNMAYLLNGLAQHEMYHLGQIVLLRNMLQEL
jgi:uncharacterized damage-inducible protein DinB